MEKNHQETQQVPQVDATRRRLTKAGIATPAVLGMLASRQVLADVHWNCTISGQVSGNVSSHGEVACTSLGSGQSAWKTTYSCDNTNGKCPAGPTQQTLVSEVFPNLSTIYLYVKNETLYKAPPPNGVTKVASIYDILAATATNDTDALYGQKALVILLNAKNIADTSLYPVTQYQAEQLFIAAATGGVFTDTNPSVNWSNTQVHTYIDLLWHS